MYYQIDAPLTLSCHPALPASKSISNRVLILNHLSGNHSEISNLSDCDDTFVMKKALSHPSEITDIMAAGTAMRFLTDGFPAYLAGTIPCQNVHAHPPNSLL